MLRRIGINISLTMLLIPIKILNDQAVCFFQIAVGAGLGLLVVGRHGNATRLEFDPNVLQSFIDGTVDETDTDGSTTKITEDDGAPKVQTAVVHAGEGETPKAGAPPNQLG
jgi:hypothetical protein